MAFQPHSNTTAGRVEIIDDHTHMSQFVYPNLADGVVVTGAAGAWTLGALVEVIPVNTITDPFDIHWINVEAASAVDTYVIVLYYGAGGAETEWGRTRFTKSAVLDIQAGVPFQCPIVPKNTRIAAAVANSAGGAETVTISVMGHPY